MEKFIIEINYVIVMQTYLSFIILCEQQNRLLSFIAGDKQSCMQD